MSAYLGHAEHQQTHFLKLGGHLRHDNAAPLEQLIEHWFADDTASIQAVVIDLNELEFMDSTVIGLLACIVRELDQRNLPKATVFSTQAEINELLHCLCLDEAITLIEASAQSGSPLELSHLQPSAEAGQVTAASILKAHEQLIELNDANRSAFQPVVDLLRSA